MKLFRTLQEIISDIFNGRIVRILFDKDFMYLLGISEGNGYFFCSSFGNELILGKLSSWKKLFPNFYYRPDVKKDICISQFSIFENSIFLMPELINRFSDILIPFFTGKEITLDKELQEKNSKIANNEIVYVADEIKEKFIKAIDFKKAEELKYKEYKLNISELASFFEQSRLNFFDLKYDGTVFADSYVVSALYEYVFSAVENSQKVPRSLILPFIEDKKYRKQMKNKIVEIEEITLNDFGYRRNAIKYHVKLEHNSIYSKQVFFDVLLYCFDRERKTQFIVGSTNEDIQRFASTSNVKLDDYSVITHQKIADITKANKKQVSMLIKSIEELTQTKLIVSFRDSNKDVYRYILSPIDGYVKFTINNGHVVQRFKIHDFLMQNMKSFVLMPTGAFTNLSKLPIPNRSKQLASDVLEYILSRKNTGMAVLDLEDFSNIYSHRLIETRHRSALKNTIEEILNAMKDEKMILKFEKIEDSRYRIFFP